MKYLDEVKHGFCEMSVFCLGEESTFFTGKRQGIQGHPTPFYCEEFGRDVMFVSLI